MKATIVAFAAAAAAFASSAQAAPIITGVNTTLTSSGYAFSFMGDTFTLSATGNSLNPVAIKNGANDATSSIFNFINGQTLPNNFYTDRGTVSFGSTTQFTSFNTPTTIPYSNGQNFIGLEATSGGQNYYGFAYFTNNVLNSYGFESIAGASITATTAIPAAVPEAATWAMMMVGLGIVGASLRRIRVSTAIRFA